MAVTIDLAPSPHRTAASEDADWRGLFNRAAFHRLNQLGHQQPLFTEVRDHSGRLLGGLSGMRDRDEVVSGFSAPFGGFDFLHSHETAENIAIVVGESLNQIAACGVRKLTLKLPPVSYSNNEGMVQFALLNSGFSVERCELNQHVPIRDWKSADEFVSRLRPPAQKTLRYLLSQDLRFDEATDEPSLYRAHTLLADNRSRKGREFALPMSYVCAARAALDPHVRMFELTSGDCIVAAALVYATAPYRELVVAWGDGPHELKRSPMILLAYRLVQRCLEYGTDVLDLGISNEPQERPAAGLAPNYGLVQFKRSVLAKIEPRLTMVAEL